MIDNAVAAAAVQMKAELKDAVATLQKTKEVDAHLLNEKFAADKDTFTFRYGGMEEYHGGLEGMIGNPDPRVAEAVTWEHTKSNESTKSFTCWWKGETSALVEYDYVANLPATEEDTNNGRREKGRDSWTLSRFMEENHELITTAALQKVEVIVLRLYTGPMYVWYNNLLRYLNAEFDEARSPFDDYKQEDSAGNAFPFKTTLHLTQRSSSSSLVMRLTAQI
jgi:hypothetical protein